MNRLNRIAKAAGFLRPRTWWYSGCIAVVMLNSIASVAVAQKPAQLPDEDGGMLQWGVAVGLLVIVLLPVLINPKRTHIG